MSILSHSAYIIYNKDKTDKYTIVLCHQFELVIASDDAIDSNHGYRHKGNSNGPERSAPILQPDTAVTIRTIGTVVFMLI